MTTYERPDLTQLKGKTIILTGCATGIGRATAKLAYQNGANLSLADWNEADVKTLIQELGDDGKRTHFRKTDVTKWYDVLEIFQETWKKFGIINAVISNAGVNAETLFDETFDDLGRLAEPDLTNVKVNLFGHLYVVRCALHYFAKWPESRSQIVLTGSLSSYLDSPPLYQYGAAKFGVLGLMRCLRTQIPSAAWNATINMVAPWMTLSPLIEQRFLDMWGDLPTNQPEDVGYGLLLPVVQETLNGKAFFVADGKLVEVEDKIRETQPLWLGSEQLSAAVDEGQRRLIPKVAPPKTG